jgi:hypothetical protein
VLPAVNSTQPLFQTILSACSGLPFDVVAFVFKNGPLAIAAHFADLLSRAGVRIRVYIIPRCTGIGASEQYFIKV